MKIFTVSNTPNGPWEGHKNWTTREAMMYASSDDSVAGYLDDDGEKSSWYIKHPDGKIEKVSYYGEHETWIVQTNVR